MARIDDWMTAYQRAWESNDPDDIRALFTTDAEYRTTPYRAPKRGHDEIVQWWAGAAADEPGDHDFEWQPVAIEGDTTVVRAVTRYRGAETYHNVWVIDFDGDRARSFTEWWMEEPAPAGPDED